MRIAITGHRLLPPATETLITEALNTELAALPTPPTGISCLADGADALFARAILTHGGTLEAVIPATHYQASLPTEHHPEYDRLLAAATKIHQLPYTESTSEAHLAAGLHMLTLADHLWAVWDGLPAKGPGGTADIVQAAQNLNLPIHIIWPPTASRI
ncbi:hypothetical protein GCM10027589_08570 [Actinocorallia lasiicapitis]